MTPEAIAGIRAALRDAQALLLVHYRDGAGPLCVCLRPVVSERGCVVAGRAHSYAAVWHARLDYAASTQ